MTEFELNQDIAQGIEFKKYSKNYEDPATGNRHGLLEKTSSAKLSSINNEAFTSYYSTNKKRELDYDDYYDEDDYYEDYEYEGVFDKLNYKKDTKSTLAGQLETSSLKMTSEYYQYLVYFILVVTLLAFIFNIMINPEANTKNAVFVVIALLLVYFITRTIYI